LDLENNHDQINNNHPEIIDTKPSRPFTPSLGTYSLLFFMLILWPALGLSVLLFGDNDFKLDLVDPVIFIFLPTIVVQWLIFLAVLLGVHREKSSLGSLGLVRPKFSDLPKAFIFLIAANLILSGLQFILSMFGLTVSKDVDILVEKAGESIWWWLSISITAAVCEETAFRGYLMTRVKGLLRTGWLIPILLSALSFASGHTYQGTAGFILLFAYGLMFCGFYIYTGSLWPCIIAHFIQDFSAIYIYKYLDF
jgi:membrane protease YdiL (CAAX protease family)